MTTNTKQEARLTVRMPSELQKKLKQAAKISRRSINAETIYLLEQGLTVRKAA